MERLLEDASFNATWLGRVFITINAATVDQNWGELAAEEYLSQYILWGQKLVRKNGMSSAFTRSMKNAHTSGTMMKARCEAP